MCADEILARMRDDSESAWVDRLLADISDAPPIELTACERQVVNAASHGLTEGEIAVVLGKSFSTVHAQMGSAMRKLAAKNRTHAVALAIRRRLL